MAPSGSGIIGGFGAVAGAAGRQRPFPARRHVAVQLVVFDQRYPAHFQTPPPRTGQEACPTSRPAGRRIEKREPLPGSLSTVISPPIIWQNLADRQTQTGAVVPPGGGAVHLREGLEQLAQVLRTDPMPVSQTRSSVHSASPMRTLFTAAAPVSVCESPPRG